jgi:hypothetical protein
MSLLMIVRLPHTKIAPSHTIAVIEVCGAIPGYVKEVNAS